MPSAVATPIIELKDGDRYTLRAEIVTKTLAGTPLRLYAYNGSIPGPLLKVRQGATVTIEFENAIDQDTTVHWHGLRLDYRQDGTPGISQSPVPPGGKHRYTLRFPDDGIYWYHPHIREDFQQDAGLYGNIWVLPRDPQTYAPVDREVALIVDDLLIENGQQTPYGQDVATHALMGRFGNVLLVNGEEQYQLSVRAGETVRFYLTNAANARTFNLSLPGVRLKRVGGDSGRYERETWVDSVVLAPSERVIVEATFAQPGHVVLTHTTPTRTYALGQIAVATGDNKAIAEALRDSPAVQAEVAAFAPYLQAPPDYTLTVGLDMPGHGRHGSRWWPCRARWAWATGYLSTAADRVGG
ncbi:MAG: multicopper oxidase domain-containing protein [Candidatus Competibacteraceae bacterium]|nr:multicopper oxidase domain-containing protein [Candidatus Competibacteraceae bacterium]